MKKIEIERKFLLRPCSLKKFLMRHGLEYRAVPIEQFYLRSDGEGSERYRRAGDRYIHTVKSAGGLAREEREEAVDKATYLRFKARAASGLIEKTRYIVEHRGYTYELDAFHGTLKGLNFLEVEFGTMKEAKAFRVPEPFSRLVIADVSENPAFTNGALSRTMRLPTLSEGLTRVLQRIRRERKDFLKASTAVGVGPYEKMGIALQALFFTLASTVEANRQEIVNGSHDPERLHQLRVAMRKLRVLFNRFPEFFDEKWEKRHGRALEEIMAATGPLRDLDVALERIPEYRRLLKGRYKKSLESLETLLEKRRIGEERRLRKFLESGRPAKEIASLLNFAEDEKSVALTEKREDPLLPLLAVKLKKLYRKSVEAGRALNEQSPEKEYHRMRIRIKKLRYLIEFFSRVLDSEAVEEMLNRLKTIQTILGEYQDLTVQRGWLKELGRGKEFSDKELTKMLKALEKALKGEAEKRRESFHSAFGEFPRRNDLLRQMICRD